MVFMEFAFLDESGDTGGGGSKYLVTTCMHTRKKKEIVKIIRNTKRQLLNKNRTAKWLSRMGGEIKFYTFPDDRILMDTLRRLSGIEAVVSSLAFKKDKHNIQRKTKGYILGELILDLKLYKTDIRSPTEIVADVDFFNSDKCNYLQIIEHQKTSAIPHRDRTGRVVTTVKEALNYKLHIKKEYNALPEETRKLTIKIQHVNSRLRDELQALDLICGAIFQKVENSNNKYYEAILNGKMKINEPRILVGKADMHTSKDGNYK